MNHVMIIRVEIVVGGHLPPQWSEELAGLEVICLPDGTSRLCGSLPDQAALYGLLFRLRDFGLALVSLRASIEQRKPKMNFELLTSPALQSRYPRSAKYDVNWIVENQLGSHCLWLMESLSAAMELSPGMRVLDLGCGKAISSIFLAKEFDLQVWAADLWIAPSENWERIRAAGVADRAFPLRAEARELPFAEDFFDAIVGINCLQFFGADDYYLQNHLIKLVKPGGQIGMVVPGILQEFDGLAPEYLQPYWQPGYYSWHSPDWWRMRWQHTGMVTVELIDTFPDGEGYQIFRRFEESLNDGDKMISIDEGRNITFVRSVARRNGGNEP